MASSCAWSAGKSDRTQDLALLLHACVRVQIVLKVFVPSFLCLGSLQPRLLLLTCNRPPMRSGRHRGLGVHISFVRSVSMDSWSPEQLKKMQAGGNDKLNSFLKNYGIEKHKDIAAKYNSEPAQGK
eukprot:scaffold99693_cov20-Tisochrysis_lutea.AAC.2